jgi:excisionase family DNA binding protein
MNHKRPVIDTPTNKLAKLNTDQITVLIQGLVVLEGSLRASEIPLPPCLDDLKSLLSAQRNTLEAREENTMTTSEVADYLGISERYVSKLAKKGEIDTAELGKPGRGYSHRYYADSVQAYKVKQSIEMTSDSDKDRV